MKKLALVFALVLSATSAFAQDEIVLSSSEMDALLGGGNRGGRGNNNQPQIPDPISLHAQLKDLLKNGKVALDKNQEKALQTFLNTETTAMRTALEEQFRGNNNQGNRGNNNQMNMITDLTAAVTKHNTDLLTEVKAGITPDQVALITKAEKDKKVCTTVLDLVNFQQLLARNQQNTNNFRGGGGGFQDFGGFGGDFGDIFGGGGGGGGNRGGFPNNNNFNQLIPQRPSCTQISSTTPQRVAVLGEILTKGKKPFTPDQETKVSALIEGKMKLITDELKAKNNNMEQMLNQLNNSNNNNNNNQNNNQNQPPQVNVQTLTNNIVNTIMQNLGIQTNNNNNNNPGRGNRGNFNNNNDGGNRGGNNPAAANAIPAIPAAANANNNQNNQNNQGGRGNNNFNPQQEIQRKSEELYDKVAATLKPEQGAIVLKLKYDQIKGRGGADRFRGILAQEGTPLSAEQFTQVQTMLNAQNQAIRNVAMTLVQKEIQALPEGALQAAAEQYLAEQQRLNQQQQNPQQNRNNNNLSNVNQNTVAQQIIQKTLPEVSKQKVVLEKTTLDQIMTRVFTPPQVASYKLSSM